jgi:hypothetical protein
VSGGWLAASDLVGLPGLPNSFSGILRWLTKRNIASRNVPGRGGPNGTKREYLIEALPQAARAAIAARALNGNRAPIAPLDIDAAKAGAVEGAKLDLQESLAHRAAMTSRIDALKSAGALPGKSQQRMDAKLELLRAREIFQQSGALSVKASYHLFAAAYNKREVEVADWIRAHVPTISADTLRRWRRQVRRVGITALAGNYGNRKGDGKIDRVPLLRDFIIAMVVRTPHARATQVMEAMRARFRAEIPLPSMSALKSWLRAWRRENEQTLTALASPDKWKGKYMVAFGSMSEGVVRLNQRWEEDSTPGDVMLTDGRHMVLGGIDVYSRRPKILVSKTSKAIAVAALNRKMLLEFGVPEEVKTDNGTDYTSKHVARVFSSLDIKQTLCPPFQPWHKPHIERFFGTFTRGLVELLDNFIGHNVAQRKAIEERKSFADRLMKRGEVVDIAMSAAEFQKFCDDWIDAVYYHNPHRELDGRTPFEVAAAWRQPVRRIDDERALDVLLAPAAGDDGWRAVHKRGLLIDRAWFIAPELEAYVGQRVLCLELPDLGRVVVQGGAEHKFICIAECPERTGMDRKEVAVKARAMQQARVQDERRRLKETARAARTDDIVNEILVERARAAGKLAVLPQRAATHESDGLAAAAEAVDALTKPARSTADVVSSDDARRAREAIEREEIAAGNDNAFGRRRAASGEQPIFENRYERVMWIAREQKFRALTDEERQYLADYKGEQPASYRALMELVDEQLAPARKDDPGDIGSA